jgi:glycopeptide antibiotics resistance protein
MTGDTPASQTRIPSVSGWSNRILLLSLAGILFLTFFPFQFTWAARLPAHASPFLLGGVKKNGGTLDVFLNILLFMPIGFGVSEKLRERGWTWKPTIFAAWIAGTLLSYSVEFLQLHTPSRVSRWEDVFTNGTGAAAGFVLFELCGKWVVTCTAKAERGVRASLTLRRAALLLPIYFVLWFTLSSALQKETRLTNWDPKAQLLIGDDAGENRPSAWKGTISRLQLWDRPLPNDLALALTAGAVPTGYRSGLLVSYDFLSPQPLQDQMSFLPALAWTPQPPSPGAQDGLVLDGRSRLSSPAPVPDLIEALQKTNRFSLEVACTPAETAEADGVIISISHSPRLVDLDVQQVGASLVLSLRSPLTVGHGRLDWPVRDVFAAGQHRDVLLSYDGSTVSLYADGSKHPGVFALGPGAALAKLIRRIKPAELEGYNYIYEALIFFPAGALFGMATLPTGLRDIPVSLFLAVEFFLSPWLLDRILSHVSGRPVSLGSISLCLILLIAGSLWINADRRIAAKASSH